MTVLDVADLHVRFTGVTGVVDAVRGVSLRVGRGRTLGLVGESGSGKSVTALAILRLLPQIGAESWATRIAFCGQDLRRADEAAMRAVRGAGIAMVFQEPGSSLNPVHRVGDQVAEALVVVGGVGRAEAARRTTALFDEVGLSDPRAMARRYPHQLSGGQQQRVMIAMALSRDPALLIADEPTTALDVATRAQLLDLLRDLRDRRGLAVLHITHDLDLVRRTADDVVVMREGKVVEAGPVAEVLPAPARAYTRALLASRLDPMPARPPAAPDAAPVLEVRDLSVRYPVREGVLGRVVGEVRAVEGVGLRIARGRTLGLVGPSGSGKSTLCRAILRLVEPASGVIRLLGRDWLAPRGAALRRLRRHVQIVFQDPSGALDPRQPVASALTEAMAVHDLGADAAERLDRAAALLAEVGLSPDHLDRLPHELSGGQRQRVVLARALAVEPDLLVCDEPVSALDATVQAQVLDLLRAVQERRGLACLFVSHDPAVVRYMADEVVVMEGGRVQGAGPMHELRTRG